MKQIYFILAIFLCCSISVFAQGHPNHLRARGIDPASGQVVQSLKSSSESFLTPSANYRSKQLFAPRSFAAFDVHGNYFYGNDDNTIYRYTLKGELINTYVKPADYAGMVWASFLNVSSDGNYLYAGFTNMGNSDDRIYKVDIETGDWTLLFSISGNFDLDFRNGKALVSGLNSADWNDPNSIFVLDESGDNNHQKIIETGGSSAGLAVDATGNIYYGTYFFDRPNAVYRWLSVDVNNAILNNDFLTIDDAEKISDLPAGHGVYDCEVDAAGNLLFNINSFATPSLLVKWNGTSGDGLNYDVLAEAPVTTDWITMIKTTGNINSPEFGNVLFTTVYGKPIAQVTRNSEFIAEVLEFVPAPGQFINKSPGLPASANSIVGKATGLVTLGAFGGYVVFRFNDPVQNHPDNPYGIDFTIFGNPLATWSEPGSVWVMKDENGNGLPDDTWYELAGSDYWFSSTIKNYEVTYTNPGGTVAVDVPWTDNQGNNGAVLKNNFHNQSYYPLNINYPYINEENNTLLGTIITGGLDTSNPSNVQSLPRAFGYADNNARRSAPWTTPNNPYNKTNENAGGDGFDISWAVDSDGNYVELDQIHFIKVVTAMQGNGGWLGEVSTEIAGAAIVTPNPDITGVEEMIVIKDEFLPVKTHTHQLEAFAFNRGRVQPATTLIWETNKDFASVSSSKTLEIATSYLGSLIVTASFEDNPTITASKTIKVDVNNLVVSNPIEDVNVRINAANMIIPIHYVFSEPGFADAVIVKSVKTNTNQELVSCEIADEELTLSFTPNQLGESEITLEGLFNGQKITTLFTVTVSPSTGTVLPDTSSFSVYPNPSNGVFRINSKSTTEIYGIQIFNINGGFVYHAKSSSEIIDISNYPSGVYFIKIETSEGIVTQKIIKQ